MQHAKQLSNASCVTPLNCNAYPVRRPARFIVLHAVAHHINSGRTAPWRGRLDPAGIGSRLHTRALILNTPQCVIYHVCSDSPARGMFSETQPARNLVLIATPQAAAPNDCHAAHRWPWA